MQPTHGAGTCFSASLSRPQQSENAQRSETPSFTAYCVITAGLLSSPTQLSLFMADCRTGAVLVSSCAASHSLFARHGGQLHGTPTRGR